MGASLKYGLPIQIIIYQSLFVVCVPSQTVPIKEIVLLLSDHIAKGSPIAIEIMKYNYINYFVSCLVMMKSCSI